MDEIREFIIEEGLEGMQTFRTRNVLGDPMDTIYLNGKVQIDICLQYRYLEIFGLTDEEYSSLSDILNIC